MTYIILRRAKDWVKDHSTKWEEWRKLVLVVNNERHYAPRTFDNVSDARMFIVKNGDVTEQYAVIPQPLEALEIKPINTLIAKPIA